MQPVLPVALHIMIEGRFADVDDRAFVKRDVVHAQPGQRQPGLQHHLVERETAIAAQQAKFADITIKMAQAAVIAHHRNRDHASHHRCQGNVEIVGQQFDVEAKVA
ncbi:hypothetical protein D9M69_731960 [compost metagenome]